MAGTSLTFDISGLPPVQTYFTVMAERAENTLPLMTAIGHEGMQQTLRRFDAQRGPDGTPWVPSMAAKREKRKTLIKTGQFKLNTFSSEATNDTATWGTNAPQGRIFQLGGTINHPTREGTVRLRTQPDGKLMRQVTKPNLAVFAKSSHKLAKTVPFKAESYAISVIARPFLGVNGEDLKVFGDLAVSWMTGGQA